MTGRQYVVILPSRKFLHHLMDYTRTVILAKIPRVQVHSMTLLERWPEGLRRSIRGPSGFEGPFGRLAAAARHYYPHPAVYTMAYFSFTAGGGVVGKGVSM